MAYHRFRNDEGDEYGSFEVFYNTRESAEAFRAQAEQDGEEGCDLSEPGWYWWACFPGCSPDGDPSGPFDSESAAIDDAQSNA